MRYWKKISHLQQEERITEALAGNIDFSHRRSLGIPASRLDSLVFHEGAIFLKDAPLLRSYVQNPNHIGCHTLGSSENFFSGTQKIEREVIDILSVDLLKAEENSCDGYVASGGTEANIEAVWIYRNYFLNELGLRHEEIALLASEDTHYSVAKAANLLNLSWYPVTVTFDNREVTAGAVEAAVRAAQLSGVKAFIVIANMATTMFGSVDNPDVYTDFLTAQALPFKMHVDGAFGGFIYPVSAPGNALTFVNPLVSSITLDAHKMLQAPYGTGIFLVRKGLIQRVLTTEAQYVAGMDVTLSGSRSGANAIAVWMILATYGPFGYLEKINKLLYRTSWCCRHLDKLGVKYYRNPRLNIIAISAAFVTPEIAEKYGLVPDTHSGSPAWYKIVVMEHVEIEDMQALLADVVEMMGENLTTVNREAVAHH